MRKSGKNADVRIRRGKSGDAVRLADLSGQLGYPTTLRQMQARFRRVLEARDGACFVAENKAQGVIGWVHVSTTPMLETDARAEVNGLVVDEAARSAGAGALLLEAAERWAARRGCRMMSVRSNVIRERAHGFYLQQGYEHYKTQKAFRKALNRA